MLKKILLALLTFLILFWIAIGLIDSQQYGNFLARQLEKIARTRGIQLTISQLDWHSWEVTGKQINATLLIAKKLPLSIALEKLRINLQPRQLLGGELLSDFDLSLYDGSINGEISRALASHDFSLTSQATGINLAEHLQLQGLGISQGELSYQLPELSYQDTSWKLENLVLSLQNLTKLGETTLPPQLTGLPLPITLTEISDLNLDTVINLAGDQLTLGNLELTSSWGGLKGNVACQIEIKPIQCSGVLSGTLTPQGQETLGPLLSLLSNGRLTSQASKFRLEFKPGRLLVTE